MTPHAATLNRSRSSRRLQQGGAVVGLAVISLLFTWFEGHHLEAWHWILVLVLTPTMAPVFAVLIRVFARPGVRPNRDSALRYGLGLGSLLIVTGLAVVGLTWAVLLSAMWGFALLSLLALGYRLWADVRPLPRD